MGHDSGLRKIMVGIAPKHFNIPLHKMFIDSHGITTTWYKSLICPCMDPTDGGHPYSCTLCGGYGIYYYDPAEIKALYTSLDFGRNLQVYGLIDEVLLNATFRDDHAVGDGDRFIPEYEIVIEQEMFTRGKIRPGGGSDESIMYRYPVELLKIVDQNGVSYTPEIDVGLSADAAGYTRLINWITAGPAAGVRYSVRYSARAEFEVFLTQPRVRVEYDIKFATFCRLRRITSVRGDS
jgi:hypothetical protein